MRNRVQEILHEELPMIGLIGPSILAAARSEVGGFRPAKVQHYTLWNAEACTCGSRRIYPANQKPGHRRLIEFEPAQSGGPR